MLQWGHSIHVALHCEQTSYLQIMPYIYVCNQLVPWHAEVYNLVSLREDLYTY